MSYKRFPFLADPKDYAVRLLMKASAMEEIAEDEKILSLAREKLSAYASGAPPPLGATEEEEVLSYWLALIAVRAGGSVRLLQRALRHEVTRLSEIVSKSDLDGLVGLARAMGIRCERKSIRIPWIMKAGKVIERELEVAVKAADYIRLTAGTKEKRLKLSNSFLLGGHVYLDRAGLALLLSEAAPRIILERLRSIEPPESPAFEELVRYARSLEARLGGIREEAFPKCIWDILSKAKVSELDDEEVFVLLSFLSSIGAPEAFVEEVLREAGIAEAEAPIVARALLSARGFTPYKCEQLRARGICGCDEDLVKAYRKSKERG